MALREGDTLQLLVMDRKQTGFETLRLGLVGIRIFKVKSIPIKRLKSMVPSFQGRRKFSFSLPQSGNHPAHPCARQELHQRHPFPSGDQKHPRAAQRSDSPLRAHRSTAGAAAPHAAGERERAGAHSLSLSLAHSLSLLLLGGRSSSPCGRSRAPTSASMRAKIHRRYTETHTLLVPRPMRPVGARPDHPRPGWEAMSERERERERGGGGGEGGCGGGSEKVCVGVCARVRAFACVRARAATGC